MRLAERDRSLTIGAIHHTWPSAVGRGIRGRNGRDYLLAKLARQQALKNLAITLKGCCRPSPRTQRPSHQPSLTAGSLLASQHIQLTQDTVEHLPQGQ